MTFSDEARSSPLKFFTLVITSQPANAVGVLGGQAVFTFTYISNSPGTVTFAWQIQTDGSTWADLVETAGYYEGVATATLTVKAIDNYLATFQVYGSLKFRCRAVFQNTVPTFTSAATLTIATYLPTYWSTGREFYIQAIGPSGGFGEIPNFDLALVIGLTGPFTYLWSFVSGDAAVLIDNATAARPTFGMAAAPPLGIHLATWSAVITGTSGSITIDPVQVAIIGVAADVDFKSNLQGSTRNGAQQSTAVGITFVGPWTPIVDISKRRLASSPITIATPLVSSTTFSIVAEPSAGSATALLFYVPVTIPGFNGYSYGSSVWGAQPTP